MPQRPVPLLLAAPTPFTRSIPVSTFARGLRLTLVLAGIWAALQGPAWAQPPSPPPENTDAWRTVQLPLRQLTGNRLTLRGAHSEQRIHLGVRLDEMVVRARLNLAVTPSPALLPTLSHLQVRLNDKLLSVVPIRADHSGERIVRTIELDPRLFVDDNWLSLRLVGHYTLACEDPLHNSLWAEVDVDATGFELAIRPLALEDELALFPAPWFDRRGAGRVEVPMVLGPQPGRDRLSTASIMASWLGSLAGERGAVFPVRRDRLPNRHAIVLVSPQQPGPEGLELPEALGPTVRLMRHPKLPHVKLLVLQGRNEQELRTAALGLILGRQAMSGSTVLVHELAPIPVRPPYDAPNWVATDKPVRLGELVPERAALQLQGAHPDAVRVRWRTPPDLWQGPGRSALLNLRYRTAVPTPTDNALMSLALNDSFVRAWRLAAASSSDALGGLGRWLGDADEASGSVPLAAQDLLHLQVWLNFPLALIACLPRPRNQHPVVPDSGLHPCDDPSLGRLLHGTGSHGRRETGAGSHRTKCKALPVPDDVARGNGPKRLYPWGIGPYLGLQAGVGDAGRLSLRGRGTRLDFDRRRARFPASFEGRVVASGALHTDAHGAERLARHGTATPANHRGSSRRRGLHSPIAQRKASTCRSPGCADRQPLPGVGRSWHGPGALSTRDAKPAGRLPDHPGAQRSNHGHLALR